MNTRPDPDAALDKLLEQAFGGDRLPDAGVDCLDAEQAAAFVDAGLLATQHDAIEAHVAGCARCQALVGSIVRSSTPASAPAASTTRSRWIGWAVPLGAAAGVMLAVALWQGRVAQQEPAGAGAPAASALDAVSRERPAEPQAAPPSPARGSITQAPSAPMPAAPPASPVSVGQNAAAALERREATGAGARERDQARASRMAESQFSSKAEIIVTSPDPAVRWRVRPAAIERTTDGGSTWTATTVAGDIDLAAGSAPSTGTCWMVGTAGTVLRTTDGRTWQRLAFPEAVALTGVEAADERTATVTTADGRRFRTTDGGASWLRAPLQETPAAPF